MKRECTATFMSVELGICPHSPDTLTHGGSCIRLADEWRYVTLIHEYRCSQKRSEHDSQYSGWGHEERHSDNSADGSGFGWWDSDKGAEPHRVTVPDGAVDAARRTWEAHVHHPVTGNDDLIRAIVESAMREMDS